MSTRLLPLVAVTAFLLACGGFGQVTGPRAPVMVPGTPPAQGAPTPAPAVAPAAPAPAPEPAAPTGPCADDCLLLMEHRYEDLASGGYCELCGDQDPLACELDWPSSDLMPCDEFDRLRNCIYARLGYDFEGAPEWRAVFDQEPWYEPDPKFRWSNVSKVQVANANTLKEIVRKRRCAR